MRINLLSCEVFAREIAAVVKTSPHEVKVSFFSKGLHELPSCSMAAQLQDAVDSAPDCDAIVMAYAFCNHGIVGLCAPSVPLVIPRAHDCMTLLLGSRQRYSRFFFENPGTYFRSTGWIERRRNPEHLRRQSKAELHGLNDSLELLSRKYGDEKGSYLGSILGGQTSHYNQLAFIETGVEPSDRFERGSRCEAEQKGWRFTKLKGDLSLLRKLVNGDWNDDEFLVLQPGRRVTADYSDRIISSVPANQPPTYD